MYKPQQQQLLHLYTVSVCLSVCVCVCEHDAVVPRIRVAMFSLFLSLKRKTKSDCVFFR